MNEFESLTIQNVPKEEFQIGDFIGIKSEFFLLIKKRGFIVSKNNNVYKIRLENSDKVENVKESLLTSLDSEYEISITPYKDEKDYNIDDKNFTIFSALISIELDFGTDNYYFYIFLNKDTNEWCFIQENKFVESINEELNSHCNIDQNNRYIVELFKKYFNDKPQFKLQDESILKKIGNLKNPIIKTVIEKNKSTENSIGTIELSPNLRTKDNDID